MQANRASVSIMGRFTILCRNTCVYRSVRLTQISKLFFEKLRKLSQSHQTKVHKSTARIAAKTMKYAKNIKPQISQIAQIKIRRRLLVSRSSKNVGLSSRLPIFIGTGSAGTYSYGKCEMRDASSVGAKYL